MYLATVARETGWAAEYILWALPYCAGLGIVHAAAVHHGEIMEFSEEREGVSSEREGMREELEAVRKREAEKAPAVAEVDEDRLREARWGE